MRVTGISLPNTEGEAFLLNTFEKPIPRLKSSVPFSNKKVSLYADRTLWISVRSIQHQILLPRVRGIQYYATKMIIIYPLLWTLYFHLQEIHSEKGGMSDFMMK